MPWDGEEPPQTFSEYHDYLIEHLKADHIQPAIGALFAASAAMSLVMADQVFPQQAHNDELLASLTSLATMALFVAHLQPEWLQAAVAAEYRDSGELRQRWPIFQGLAEKIVVAFPAPPIPLDDLL